MERYCTTNIKSEKFRCKNVRNSYTKLTKFLNFSSKHKKLCGLGCVTCTSFKTLNWQLRVLSYNNCKNRLILKIQSSEKTFKNISNRFRLCLYVSFSRFNDECRLQVIWSTLRYCAILVFGS